MHHHKIAIIGAGAVGTTTAYALMLRNITAEILLVDIDENRTQGEILDLSDALAFSDTNSIKHVDLTAAKEASIIIITAGVAQQPGQTRTDLAKANATIIRDVFSGLRPLNENSIVIMVSNPLDSMTYLAQQIAGLPKSQVFGTGTFLDTQRLRHLLAERLAIHEASIHAYVLGEHGDSQFPAWSAANVATAPLASILPLTEQQKTELATATRNKAYDIINRKGATYYGIAACISAICEDIIFDGKRSVTLSTYSEELEVCLSLPVILGETGISRVLPVPLNDEEWNLLKSSADNIRQVIEIL